MIRRKDLTKGGQLDFSTKISYLKKLVNTLHQCHGDPKKLKITNDMYFIVILYDHNQNYHGISHPSSITMFAR